MNIDEIFEGQKVRHQFGHGRSFEIPRTTETEAIPQEFTYGVITEIKSSVKWTGMVTVEIDGLGAMITCYGDLEAN